MTETQRRIRAYKKALPELRERVIAVALLLAMSASMLGTASFAWITLSTAPEVSGMATTVAANGNLEIALAHGPSRDENNAVVAAEEPEESAVGDSSVTQGIVNSNITWGNLVNLSEREYGISVIKLRPALLNNVNLDRYPLYGATYGSDGRVVNTENLYEYTSYQQIDKENDIWSFASGTKTQYGVRAISTVGYDTTVGTSILTAYMTAANSAYKTAATNYRKLIDPKVSGSYVLAGNRSCIAALEGLVGVFAQDKINTMTVDLPVFGKTDMWPKGQHNVENSCSPYIYNFYEMLIILRDDIMSMEGEGLRQMANSQAYSKTSEGQAPNAKTFERLVPLDANDEKALLHYTDAQLKSRFGIQLATYDQFKSDYQIVLDCIWELENNDKVVGYGGIEKFSDPNDPNLPKIVFDDVKETINKLVNIGSTTINGTDLNHFGGSAAAGLISGGNANVVIQEGLLVRFEARTIDGKENRVNADVTVSVQTSIIKNLDVDGNVKTTSYNVSEGAFMQDLRSTGAGGVAGKGESVAEDTYGLAIDLWVRTNHPNAVLTLEGNVLTETIHKQDANGNYLYTITIGETPYEAYKTDLEAADFYYVSTGEKVTQEIAASERVETEVITGYEGENRVWSEEALMNMADKGYLEKDSTTQGSGSCFVFYANSKPQQQKLLEMLQYFYVAFITGSDTKLATAKLDVEKAFVNQGKVTVPMKLVDSKVTYDDGENEEPQFGIMNLVPNQATQITAVVYLDGQGLKNENVLSADDMNGQLNIQFSTNALLQPSPDDKLQREYRTITVSAQSADGQSWPLNSGGEVNPRIVYDAYDPAGRDITVSVNVEGSQPGKISGAFVRMINATQGSPMDRQDFSQGTAVVAAETESDAETGTWTATFHLTDPGKYVFSDLLVDGIQYPLEPASETNDYLTVEIPGLSLISVGTRIPGTYFTDKSVDPVTVTADIRSDVGTPRSVTAYFTEKNNPANMVSAIMSLEADTRWSGTANITKSGTYILDFIMVDGQTLEVPVGSRAELTFHLGLQASVFSDEENGLTKFPMEADGVRVDVAVLIENNANQMMKNLDTDDEIILVYNYNNNPLDTTQCYLESRADGYYTGKLNLTKAGRWYFEELTIGTKGIINDAKAAPVLVVSSDKPLGLEPVDGRSAFAESLQYSFVDPAKLYVRITDPNAVLWAELAKVDAEGNILKDAQGNDQTILVKSDPETGGYDNGQMAHRFELYESGTWKLLNVYCQDVEINGWYYRPTDAAGVKGESASYPLTLPEEDQITFKVVDKLNITGNITYTAADGTNATHADLATPLNLSGSFLQTHDVTLNLTVTEGSGAEQKNILTGATWNVSYDATTDEAYGHYDGATQAPFYNSTSSVSGNTVSMTNPFRYAGKYATTGITLHLDLNGDGNKDYDYTVTGITPAITVSSEAPVVKFTATNPEEGKTFKVAHKKENPQKGDVRQDLSNDISDDGYSVTCYYTANADDCSCLGYTAPKVTVGLYGMGTNFDTATLTIISEGTADNVQYTFNKSELDAEGNEYDEQRFGKDDMSTRVYLGTNAEAKTLAVTLGTESFTIYLENSLKATLEY